MALTWQRSFFADSNYAVGGFWLSAIPNGQTYRRVRWSWGFTAITPTTVDMVSVTFAPMTMGLVTTYGTGTETPPNARSASSDQAPPTRRWIWWETRQPVVSAIDADADVVAWRDSGPQEEVDTKVNVLAVGAPAGQTLNLWASWAASYNPFAAPEVTVWVSAAVLYG
jgi:hypothetical protein